MFVAKGKQVLNNNVVLANCKSEAEAQKLADSKNNPRIEIKPLTNITLSENSNTIKINNLASFSFSGDLPTGNYKMPVMKQGSNAPLLFETIVTNGEGDLTVTFSESGIYYIDKNMLDTDLTVNGNSTERFTLYVVQ